MLQRWFSGSEIAPTRGCSPETVSNLQRSQETKSLNTRTVYLKSTHLSFGFCWRYVVKYVNNVQVTFKKYKDFQKESLELSSHL